MSDPEKTPDPSDEDEVDFHDGDDDDDDDGIDLDDMRSYGDIVIFVKRPECHISLAVPADTDPALVGRLLDLAVEAVGKLKTQMQ